jgi:ABC-type lipoprotein release transport system permease subunit
MKISANLNIALKSASYYRKTGILVALGLALAGAVTTGSLIIGDCVKGSIRHVALARLGGITHSVKLNGYARAELSDDISKRLNGNNQSTCPAILVKGVVENQDSGEAAPIVNIIGIDQRFAAFYGSNNALKLKDGEATLNAALAKDLSVKVGDSILVTTDKQSAIPTGSLFAHIDPVQNQRSLRLEVKSILPDTGPGGFRMDAYTQVPRNVFVSLSELSKAMEKPNKANTIFLHSSNSSSTIHEAIKETSKAQDYGINIKADSKAHRLIIQSDSVAFSISTLAGVSQAAKQINPTQGIVSVYLANSLISLAQPAKTLHYCVVAAVDPQPGFDFVQGGPITSNGQIVLNSWAAQDMGAKLGDKLAVSYLVAQPGGRYIENRLNVTVHGIVNISGSAADSGLVPTFEGITDAEKIGDWQPPFPVDLKKVTPRDESYWDKYKAIPKAFLHPDDLLNIPFSLYPNYPITIVYGHLQTENLIIAL